MQLPPSCVTCNAAISACESTLRWEPAMQNLRAIRELRLSPDLISLNAAASASEKQSAWSQAASHGHLLWTAGFNRFTKPLSLFRIPSLRIAMMKNCSLPTLFWEVLAIVTDVPRYSHKPDGITRSAAIFACDRAHRWQNVLQLAAEMGGLQLELDLWSA